MRTCPLIIVLALAAACHDPRPGAAGGRRITSNVQDWRDEVIYQVVVDRFADGDYSNNWNIDPRHLGRFQGGDWRGLRERIPYLKALGVTALWISPVVRNIEEDAGFAGYHGYWTQDFTQVNPHFGDLAELQRTVDELHESGFKVILDIVTNHIAQLWYYDVNMNGRPDDMIFGGGGTSYGSGNKDNPGNLTRFSEWDPDYDSRGVQAFTALGEAGPAPAVWVYMPGINRVPVLPDVFQDPDWYHRRGRITVWENRPPLGTAPCETAPDNNIELCDYVRKQEVLGDFPGGLKDLATEKPEVQAALIKVFQRWIELGDFDGFRIDTLKHVDHDFWRRFCPAVRRHAKGLGKERFLMFGEAFSGADRLLSSYTEPGQVDSVFYFSQKYRVFDNVFKRGAATSEIRRLHEERVKLYNRTPQPDGAGAAPAELLINFLDNHDVARFLHDGTEQALRSALVYLLTSVGVPCIYYGTEQLFDGGNDPSNREVLWRGNPGRGLAPFDTGNETFKLIRALIDIRKQHAPLRRGDFTLRWTTDATGSESDAGIVAYERSLEGERVVVVINTSECGGGVKTFSSTKADGEVMVTGFAAGTALENVLPDDDAADKLTVAAGGELDVRVPCRGAKILVEAK
jgi:glycosidase